MEGTIITRRKRFQRRKTPRPVQITERDIEILRHVFEYRFLGLHTSEVLFQEVTKSSRGGLMLCQTLDSSTAFESQ